MAVAKNCVGGLHVAGRHSNTMVKIVPYTESESGSGAGIQREDVGRKKRRRDFLLPDSPPPDATGAERAIRIIYYLAMEDDVARGGMVLGDYPAALGGTSITATVCIAPLSEGIIDPKYSMLGMQFIKFLQSRAKYGFATGMGDPMNPYPRLLRASGWTILRVPCFFRVCRAGRFLRELGVLNSTTGRRILSRVAAGTGLGAVGIAAVHARGWLLPSRKDWSAETVEQWGPWVDEIWEAVRGSCAFAVARDFRTLVDLYPPETRLLRYSIRRGGQAVGWAAAYDTVMQNSKFFGNLRVATILDCVARPEDLAMSMATVSDALNARTAWI